MTRWHFALALIPAMLLTPAGYSQECQQLDLDVQQVLPANYDQGAAADLNLTFIFTVDILDASCTSLPDLFVSAPGAASNFRVDLVNGASSIEANRVSGSNFQNSGGRLKLKASLLNQLFNNGVLEVDMLEIAAGQATIAGTYSATLTAELGTVSTDFNTEVSTGSEIEILEGADLVINVIDFGVVEGPTVRIGSFLLRSNVPYQMQIQSENAGAMRHSTLSGPAASLPYQAYVDDSAIDLSGAGGTVILRESTNGLPRAETIEFVLTDTSGKWAGDYQDIVTYTLTAY